MGCEISGETATVNVNGDFNVWVGGFFMLMWIPFGLLLTHADLLLFKAFGWFFILSCPLGLYEIVKMAPGASFQVVIHRSERWVTQTAGEGLLRHKTQGFVDMQVYYVVVSSEHSSVKHCFVQLRCKEGDIWVAQQASEEAALKISAELAEWLGVPLRPAVQIGYMELWTAELIFPRLFAFKRLLDWWVNLPRK